MTIYRCIATGHTPEGELWVTGLHVQKIGGSTSAAATAWHNAFSLLWLGAATPADSIKQLVSTLCGCDETIVNELDFNGRNVTQVRTTETLVGTSTANPLSPTLSAVVSMRTALPTRAGRGRMFLPPMTDDAQDTTLGKIDATACDRISLAAKGMRDSLTAATYNPLIWHRPGTSGDLITSNDVADIWRRQGRRSNKLLPVRHIQV